MADPDNGTTVEVRSVGGTKNPSKLNDAQLVKLAERIRMRHPAIADHEDKDNSLLQYLKGLNQAYFINFDVKTLLNLDETGTQRPHDLTTNGVGVLEHSDIIYAGYHFLHTSPALAPNSATFAGGNFASQFKATQDGVTFNPAVQKDPEGNPVIDKVTGKPKREEFTMDRVYEMLILAMAKGNMAPPHGRIEIDADGVDAFMIERGMREFNEVFEQYGLGTVEIAPFFVPNPAKKKFFQSDRNHHLSYTNQLIREAYLKPAHFARYKAAMLEATMPGHVFGVPAPEEPTNTSSQPENVPPFTLDTSSPEHIIPSNTASKEQDAANTTPNDDQAETSETDNTVEAEATTEPESIETLVEQTPPEQATQPEAVAVKAAESQPWKPTFDTLDFNIINIKGFDEMLKNLDESQLALVVRSISTNDEIKNSSNDEIIGYMRRTGLLDQYGLLQDATPATAETPAPELTPEDVAPVSAELPSETAAPQSAAAKLNGTGPGNYLDFVSQRIGSQPVQTKAVAEIAPAEETSADGVIPEAALTKLRDILNEKPANYKGKLAAPLADLLRSLSDTDIALTDAEIIEHLVEDGMITTKTKQNKRSVSILVDKIATFKTDGDLYNHAVEKVMKGEITDFASMLQSYKARLESVLSDEKLEALAKADWNQMKSNALITVGTENGKKAKSEADEIITGFVKGIVHTREYRKALKHDFRLAAMNVAPVAPTEAKLTHDTPEVITVAALVAPALINGHDTTAAVAVHDVGPLDSDIETQPAIESAPTDAAQTNGDHNTGHTFLNNAAIPVDEFDTLHEPQESDIQNFKTSVRPEDLMGVLENAVGAGLADIMAAPVQDQAVVEIAAVVDSQPVNTLLEKAQAILAPLQKELSQEEGKIAYRNFKDFVTSTVEDYGDTSVVIDTLKQAGLANAEAMVNDVRKGTTAQAESAPVETVQETRVDVTPLLQALTTNDVATAKAIILGLQEQDIPDIQTALHDAGHHTMAQGLPRALEAYKARETTVPAQAEVTEETTEVAILASENLQPQESAPALAPTTTQAATAVAVIAAPKPASLARRAWGAVSSILPAAKSSTALKAGHAELKSIAAEKQKQALEECKDILRTQDGRSFAQKLSAAESLTEKRTDLSEQDRIQILARLHVVRVENGLVNKDTVVQNLLASSANLSATREIITLLGNNDPEQLRVALFKDKRFAAMAELGRVTDILKAEKVSLKGYQMNDVLTPEKIKAIEIRQSEQLIAKSIQGFEAAAIEAGRENLAAQTKTVPALSKTTIKARQCLDFGGVACVESAPVETEEQQRARLIRDLADRTPRPQTRVAAIS